MVRLAGAVLVLGSAAKRRARPPWELRKQWHGQEPQRGVCSFVPSEEPDNP